MTGIHRTPATTPPATDKDERWQKRQEAWNKAEEASKSLAVHNTPEMRNVIANLAAETGFWSVWRVVFAHDASMLQMIDTAFQGTAPDCFDRKTRHPIARPRGVL